MDWGHMSQPPLWLPRPFQSPQSASVSQPCAYASQRSPLPNTRESRAPVRNESGRITKTTSAVKAANLIQNPASWR